ncbi:MAG: chorismate mutase [Clostridia bacterium]|nr:chorismate mutase [Clostridia bacterium]
MMDLKNHRDRIDAIDDQLTALFKERMEIVSKVAEYKNEHGLPVTDSAREKQILEDRTADAGELKPYVRRFFKHIMKLSKEYQKERITDEE